MKELLISLLHFFGWALWIEIVTDVPRCTYYFGPFLTQKEAEVFKDGYVEDIQQEGAAGIAIRIKRCKPAKLTVDDEDFGQKRSRRIVPIFSVQS